MLTTAEHDSRYQKGGDEEDGGEKYDAAPIYLDVDSVGECFHTASIDNDKARAG
jgi:hypothetical protein